MRIYREEILKDKQETWRNFVSDRGDKDPWGTVFRVCRRGAPQRVGQIRHNGRLTNALDESINVLFSDFFPPVPVANGADGHDYVPVPPASGLRLGLQEFFAPDVMTT